MSWPASIAVALITGAIGLAVSGFVSNLAVGWYRMSSFEGASGYFVVAMALLGGIAGIIIGLVVSRMVAAGSEPAFLRALGLSLGVVLAIAVPTTGVARLLADVPPKIDGDELWLAVEVRWPEGDATNPATLPGEGQVSLHSLPRFSHTVRASRNGPLWLEDARLVDGRWVVPGAVDVFTNRGKRLIDVRLGDSTITGMLIPLGKPSAADTAWSPWYPLPNPQAPPSPYKYQQRYRVVRITQPIRLQKIGSFEVATIANGMHRIASGDSSIPAMSATFTIAWKGKPVEGFDKVGAVAVLGEGKALLVQVENEDQSGTCHLIVGRENDVETRPISACTAPINGKLLTSDAARFREARRTLSVPGIIDRATFAAPAMYRLEEAVLDTRSMTARPFPEDSASSPVMSVYPLGLSPDERSFITYGYTGGSSDNPVLVVTDLAGGTHSHQPIDGRRMRFPRIEDLDPAWVLHHFTWQRDAGGVDRLVERPGFVPIPYRGELSQDDSISQSYRIEKAGSALRAALVEFLVAEFGGVATPAEPDAYQHDVTIEGKQVKVAASGDFGYVSVSTDYGVRDEGLIARIAERFNAALKTGRYDAMFAP